MEQDDKQILNEIIAALNEVGHQLDGADRCRGYSPWAAIARQGDEVGRLVGLLSEPFRRTHAALVEDILTARHLHQSWGRLRDEIEELNRQAEPRHGPPALDGPQAGGA